MLSVYRYKHFSSICQVVCAYGLLNLITNHLPKCCIYSSMNWVSIDSYNGLSSLRRQAIIWTHAGLLSIEPLGTNFSEFLIKMQNFTFTKLHLKISSALLAITGIHRSPVNYPHKGQWRWALMFSLICAWINGWINNREAGDLDAIAPIMASQ